MNTVLTFHQMMWKSMAITVLVMVLANAQTKEQIKEQMERMGLTQEQAREMAKQRGYSDEQIEAELEKRGMKPKQQTETSPETKIGQDIKLEDRDISRKLLQKIPPDVEESLEQKEEELVVESQPQPARPALSYFGYDIFKGDPALFQASTFGAIDPDYNIGPGDEIIIMLWGETQFRELLTVDREGFIFIPETGQVFVNGLTLSRLESKLFRVLSQSYASLNPRTGKPNTFLDVSLGNLRPLRILVLGEVTQPGAYTVSPTTTLFSALYYIKGITTLGSLRDLRLIRGGKQITSVDFYDYLLTGRKVKDVRLQLDDTIFIPTRGKTVSISGEINRSAIYELKGKEDLKDLIQIAGDLRVTAYLDRVQIDRIVPFEHRHEVGMDRMYLDVDLNEILNGETDFELKDGDQVQVFSVLDLRKNVVTISGSVERPGTYDMGDSLRLHELIMKADGLLGDAYLDRVDVVRIKPDFTEQLIKLNLGEALALEPEHDIKLQALDRIQIYSLSEMIPRNYVSITGHVKRPGRYLLLENMTLYDLIFKGGGFVDKEWWKRVYGERAELVRVTEDSVTKEIIPFNLDEVLNNQGLANLSLKPDDDVRIYSLEEIRGARRFVSISGHVKRPGQYELFEKNMTLYDLLFKAGGFDDTEFKGKAFLDRADLLRFDKDGITQGIIPFDLGQVLSNPESEQNFILAPGDEVRIYPQAVFNAVKPVTIDGVVKNPGQYTLKTGMTIKDLILEAGGLSENVYRYKLEVARVDPDEVSENTYAEVINLDMDNDYSIMNIKYNVQENPGEIEIERQEFTLEPYDYVSVRPDPYFRLQRKVTISGAIYFPGNYTILSPEEKVTDILNRAGGLRPEAYPNASQFIRGGQGIKLSFENIIKNSQSKLNFNVLDGDEIVIAVQPNVVLVLGEVNNPGAYKFTSGRNMRDYINRAGGYTPDANKKNVWIDYPHGLSRRMKRFLPAPRVVDGSIVTVSREPESEPLDKTELAKEIAQIMASVATAISIIYLAAK